MSEDLRREMIEYLRGGAKPRAAWRTGLELELIGYRNGDFTRLAAHDLAALIGEFSDHLITEDGAIIGGCGPLGALSLEPGGQLEFSSQPYAHLDELESALKSYLEWLALAAKEKGATFLGLGFDPLRRLDEQRWVLKRRYRIMRPYLAERGRRAWDMMTRTASIQANIDFESEADLASKFIVGNRLAPIATAIFANSPFREGRLSGRKSERAAVWLETDPDRCGIAPPALDDDFSLAQFLDWVATVPMFFIRRDGDYLDLSGRPFGEYWRSDPRVEFEDFTDHLTTIFTEARLKRWSELRSADGGDLKQSLAVAAFWRGLLYSPAALDEAWRLGPRLNRDEYRELQHRVARDGLAAEYGRIKVLDLAREALALALDGLREIAPAEVEHLGGVAERVKNEGLAPADILIRNFQGSWHGRVERLVEYLCVA
jgi:glutamate--cysteine ligase